MWQLITSKISIFLAVIIIVGSAYIVGLNKGVSSEREKQLKIQFVLQQKQQDIVNKIAESNLVAYNQITVLEGKLKDETTKNARLLNSNNRLTIQFTRLYNASTKTKLSNAANNESDATTPSSIAPDRILRIMQYNNGKHLKCIADLNAWIDWYYANSLIK